MFGAYGDVVFQGGFSPSSMKGAEEYTYKVHTPLGMKPFYEFLGQGEETLEIQINLSPPFVNPEEAIKKFKKYAEKGEAKSLVLGTKYLGEYVIRRIEKVHEQILPDGTVFYVVLTLKLSKVSHAEG